MVSVFHMSADPAVVSRSWGWASGEPNGWLGMETYVEWRFGDVYGFNDVGGDKRNAFICEKYLPVTEPVTTPTVPVDEGMDQWRPHEIVEGNI